MNEVYVHTLRYRYYGRGNRQSRTMYPVSYGPFPDDDAAREWIRQRGIIRATKLMYAPAEENIKIAHNQPVVEKAGRRAGFLQSRVRQHSQS